MTLPTFQFPLTLRHLFLLNLLVIGIVLGSGGSVFARQTGSGRAPAQSGGQGGPFGLGLILGSPTAVTGKVWLDQKTAVDFGLSYAVDNYLLFYGDYLMHFPELARIEHGTLHPYLGIGGILVVVNRDRDKDEFYYGKKSGGVGMGIRVPFGIEWKPATVPIGAFAEIAPGIAIFPATGVILQAGIGIRYYF